MPQGEKEGKGYLDKYTDVFVDIMRTKIPPWRLRQAIMTNENISSLLQQRNDFETQRKQIHIPGFMYWRSFVITKPAIKKYMAEVMKKQLPYHYMICCHTPRGFDYVAEQIQKVIDMTFDD